MEYSKEWVQYCEINPVSNDEESQIIANLEEELNVSINLDSDTLCKLCKTDFKDSNKLRIHYRMHTGYFPFKCKLCKFNGIDELVFKSHFANQHLKDIENKRAETEKNEACSELPVLDVGALTHVLLECEAQTAQNERKANTFAAEPQIKKKEMTGHVPNQVDAHVLHFMDDLRNEPHDENQVAEKVDDSSGKFNPVKHVEDNLLSVEEEKAMIEKVGGVFPGTFSEERKCRVCNLVVRSAATLRVHYREHTGYHPYKCKLCDHTAKAKKTLRYHFERMHSGKAVFLERKNSKKKSISFFNNTYEAIGRFVRCKTYTAEDTLQRIQLLVSSDTDVASEVDTGQCALCGKKFDPPVRHLLKHYRFHLGDRLYECRLCDYKFDEKICLYHHLEKYHYDVLVVKKRLAEIRDSPYFDHQEEKQEDSLVGNSSEHAGCSRDNLRNDDANNQEQLISTGPEAEVEPIAKQENDKDNCSNDGEDADYEPTSDTNKESPRRHWTDFYKINAVSKKAELEMIKKLDETLPDVEKKSERFCKICEAEFVEIEKHYRQHTGYRPYQCKLCDFTGIEEATVKYHCRARHFKESSYQEDDQHPDGDGENPSLTHEWEKSVEENKLSEEEEREMITALGVEYPEEGSDLTTCGICSAEFAKEVTLRVHYREHAGFRAFKCKLCSYTAKGRYTVKYHYLSKHCETKREKAVTTRKIGEVEKLLSDDPVEVKLINDQVKKNDLDHVRAFRRVYRMAKLELPEDWEEELPNFNCILCPKKLTARRNLTRHYHHHLNERRHECKLCGYNNDDKVRTLLHVKEDHLPFLKCLQGKRIDTPEVEKKHTPVIPTEAQVLSVTALELALISEQVKYHKLNHQNVYVRLYAMAKLELPSDFDEKKQEPTCILCQKKLTKQNSLKRHYHHHLDEYRYECRMCGYKNDDRPRLLFHIKDHHLADLKGENEPIQEAEISPPKRGMLDEDEMENEDLPVYGPEDCPDRPLWSSHVNEEKGVIGPADIANMGADIPIDMFDMRVKQELEDEHDMDTEQATETPDNDDNKVFSCDILWDKTSTSDCYDRLHFRGIVPLGHLPATAKSTKRYSRKRKVGSSSKRNKAGNGRESRLSEFDLQVKREPDNNSKGDESEHMTMEELDAFLDDELGRRPKEHSDDTIAKRTRNGNKVKPRLSLRTRSNTDNDESVSVLFENVDVRTRAGTHTTGLQKLLPSGVKLEPAGTG